MRVVAGGAGHLPLAEWHVTAPHLLGPLLKVTGAARLDLRSLGQLVLRRDVFHHLVAIRAGDVARLVAAALPEDPGALGVAVEAHLVPLCYGSGVVLGEGDQPALALASPRLYVSLARAVAVLAGVLLSGGASLEEEDAPHPGLGELVVLLLVAALARLRADVVAVGRHRGRARGRRRRGGLLCGRRDRAPQDESDGEGCHSEADCEDDPPAAADHDISPPPSLGTTGRVG